MEEKVTALELFNTIAKGERMVIAVCSSSEATTTPLLPSSLCAEELLNSYFSSLSSSPNDPPSFISWLQYEYGGWVESPTIYCYTLSPSLPSSPPSSSSRETNFWTNWFSVFPSFQNQTKFLLGGYPDFLSLFPGVCSPSRSDSYILLPACILPPYQHEDKTKGGLFLGSQAHLQNVPLLSSLNIQTVVNCTNNLPYPSNASPSSSGPTHFHRVPVDDVETENISTFFPKITSIIHNAISQNNKSGNEKEKEGAVFVHCSRGASRSVSVILAYLIRYFGYSYEEALKYVREGRPEASPNPGFVAQLKKFERNWKGTGDAKRRS